jgi:dTDP-4-amino-4,6-dideoxygalactose transaminase
VETNRIPFLDLVTPHRELKEELAAVFVHALNTAGFIGGPMVEDFEKAFATFCDAQHAIGVSSGTDALRFALMAAGVGSDDAVITVPNTFIATAEAISQCGALPRFVDVNEQTYNMDTNRLADYLADGCSQARGNCKLVDKETGRRVKAVVPVHLYGQMADMDPILELAEKYNLLVIEDACQAHGAEYFSCKGNHWRKAGSMGKAAAFSFYPGKNLGACGEGGAVTTDDSELARKVRMLRDHGQIEKYYHRVEGYNGRLDAIQAGILRIKLKYLPSWNEMRRAAASRYGELFGDTGGKIMLPFEPPCCKSIYHLYVARVENRDELMRQLGSVGIGTGIHYPIPLHLQEAYRELGYREGDFPITEKLAREIVSLPMYPQLREDQQSRVVNEVMCFVSAATAC